MNIIRKSFRLKSISVLIMSFLIGGILITSNVTFAMPSQYDALPIGTVDVDYFADTQKYYWSVGAKPLDVEIVELQAFEELPLKRSESEKELEYINFKLPYSSKNEVMRPIDSVSSDDLMRFFYVGGIIKDEIGMRNNISPTSGLISWIENIVRSKQEDFLQFAQKKFKIKVLATLKDNSGVEFQDDFACINCYTKSQNNSSHSLDADNEYEESNIDYESEDSEVDSSYADSESEKSEISYENEDSEVDNTYFCEFASRKESKREINNYNYENKNMLDDEIGQDFKRLRTT